MKVKASKKEKTPRVTLAWLANEVQRLHRKLTKLRELDSDLDDRLTRATTSCITSERRCGALESIDRDKHFGPLGIRIGQLETTFSAIQQRQGQLSDALVVLERRTSVSPSSKEILDALEEELNTMNARLITLEPKKPSVRALARLRFNLPDAK